MAPVSTTEDSGPEAAPADPAGSDAADLPRPDRSGAFLAGQRDRRLAKLEALRAEGVDPYPVRFDRTASCAGVRARHAGLGPDARTGETVKVAGRVVLIRRHGRLTFADLRDGTGTIQLLVSAGTAGADGLAAVNALDLGDWAGAEGEVVTSKRGELSVLVTHVELLAKTLRPLPDKAHGLTDREVRFRQRYLDLVVNEDPRRIFNIRFKIIASIRANLAERGFAEVETPVLDTAAGGAAARPFITHHNALDLEMYMRIALELHLKRLVVGGLERVFEMASVFRNEGIDLTHNPEFTLLEAYQALADYTDMMDLVEDLIRRAARDSLGTTVVNVDGPDIDLARPFARASMGDLIERHAKVRMHPSMPREEAVALCGRFGVEVEPAWGVGRMMSEVYDATVEAELIEPTFVMDHPREISPLARAHRDDPDLTERFELIIAGRELANAYSELNDPVDQRDRFERQAELKAAGDDEAQDIDEDYIRALEFGLPPTGGLGIGVDRLVMLLAGVDSIREVILFPTLRPEGGAQQRRKWSVASALPTAASLGVQPAAAALAAEPGEGEPVAIRPLPPTPAAGEVAADEEVPRPPGEPPEQRALLPEQVAAARPPAPLPFATAVTWISVLAALSGILQILPLLPGVADDLGFFSEPFLARAGRANSTVASVVVGILLLLLARQLYRRKHSAWMAAIVLFGAAAILSALRGPDPLLVLYNAGMVVALLIARAGFPARGDPHSLLEFFRFLPAYLLAVGVYGFGALLAEESKITPDLTFGGMLETVYGGLIGLSGPYTYSGKFFEDFFPDSLLVLGIVGLVISAFLIFRPLVERGGPSGADREHARRLVREHGWDTLAYFSLRSDKSYFFSSDGEAMIAYAYTNGFALVAADPIGRPESLPRVLDEFLDYCRDRAWRAAFLSVREADVPRYKARGFNSIYLGDEAIIRCDEFSLQGGAMKPVRSAVNRVDKHHRFRLMREADATPQLVHDLNEISREWRGKAAERGFTMELGREVEGANPDFLLAVASDRDDRAVAFLRLVPCYGSDPGYSLDLMRRRPDAANGITEYLIANAALGLGEQGFRRLSLNFAAWGRLFQGDAGLSWWEKLVRRGLSVLNPFFQIESLFAFNQKFQPFWLPRSIVIEDASQAAHVGILFASVEGFLTIPVVGRFLVPSGRATTGKAGPAPAP
jgi:lysyl-tRNA synthetase, class II